MVLLSEMRRGQNHTTLSDTLSWRSGGGGNKLIINYLHIMTDVQFYEAPSTIVVELAQEGVVCTSGGNYPEWDQENI